MAVQNVNLALSLLARCTIGENHGKFFMDVELRRTYVCCMKHFLYMNRHKHHVVLNFEVLSNEFNLFRNFTGGNYS
jgi:hypothetical protein